jgi:CRISPR-associated protein Cmr1
MALEEFKFDLLLNSPAFVNDVPRGMGEGQPPHYPVDPIGIRIPSLRGVLELWYRTLWGHLASADAVYTEQARLFGSTEGGQGVTLRPAGKPQFTSGELSFSDDRLAYLYLGYGPLQNFSGPAGGQPPIATSYSKEQVRDAILVDKGHRAKFGFIARGRPEQIEAFRKALILLHLFGGIGARSRRGWGSIEVEAEGVPKPPSEQLKSWVQKTLSTVWQVRSYGAPRGPSFSAFSPETEILVTEKPYSGDYKSVLLKFYQHFARVRSTWKRAPLALQDLQDERDDFNRPAASSITKVPLRLAFGMPYQPGYRKGNRDVWRLEYYGKGAKSPDDDVTRRASPLLLKVIRLSNGQHAGVALFLKTASFFGDPKMEVGAVGKDRTQDFPGYAAIEEFFKEGWTKVPLP